MEGVLLPKQQFMICPIRGIPAPNGAFRCQKHHFADFVSKRSKGVDPPFDKANAGR
jgi:hypothetical protein